MKAKTIVSIIAAIVLVAAVIMLISRFDFARMDGDDWTLLLIIVGVLLGVIAMVVNSLPQKEKTVDDYSKYISQQTSQYNTQNLSPEQKALRELETGAIEYAEYEDKLKKIKEEEKRVKEAKDYVDESLGKLKELLQAGILSSEEFTREITRICQENGVSIPSQFIEKSIQDSVQDDSRAGKIIKLMELKDEGKLTEEEYEEQISKL